MTSRLHVLRTQCFLTCAIAAVLAASAHADVTIEERVSVSGFGPMRIGAMNGATVTTIARDRARADSNLQFESGLIRAFVRGAGRSVEIVRFDQDKIYTLEPEKKTYTETTFADQAAQLQQTMEQSRQAQVSQQQAASGVDESECEWSEPKADVIRSGEKAVIGGSQAEHVTITATQSCKDKKTGQVCDFGLILDQWLAPNFEAAEELLAYQRTYAEKLGLGASASRDFAERAEAMFGGYQGMWKEVAAKTRDINGYPVKASFGLGIGGPQCQNAQQHTGGQRICDSAAAEHRRGDWRRTGRRAGRHVRQKERAGAGGADGEHAAGNDAGRSDSADDRQYGTRLRQPRSGESAVIRGAGRLQEKVAGRRRTGSFQRASIPPQNVDVDILNAGLAREREAYLEFSADDLQHGRHPCLAQRRERIEERLADQAGSRPAGEGFQHVLPRQNPAVKQHLAAVLHCCNDFRKHGDGRRSAVQLPSAMIGDDDRIGADCARVAVHRRRRESPSE